MYEHKYVLKWVAANVCVDCAGCFDSSYALCLTWPAGALTHLMKKKVDLLQVIDAENRLTLLGHTHPISCTTKASPPECTKRGREHMMKKVCIALMLSCA